MRCSNCGTRMDRQTDADNGVYDLCPNCGYYEPVDALKVDGDLDRIYRARRRAAAAERTSYFFRSVVWWAHVVTIIPMLLVVGISLLQGFWNIFRKEPKTLTLMDRFSAWVDKGEK